jgi:hypothetical protein
MSKDGVVMESKHAGKGWSKIAPSKYFLVALLLLVVTTSQASDIGAFDFYDYKRIQITPIPCKVSNMSTYGSTAGVCTIIGPNAPGASFGNFYEDENTSNWGQSFNDYKTSNTNVDDIGKQAESCATIFSRSPSVSADLNAKPFDEDPRLLHFWAEDQDITALGKANERARQFVNWAVTRSSIDQALAVKQIWGLSRNVAISLMIVVTAILGLAIVVSRKLRSGYKFSAQNAFTKIGLSVLFIAFSASTVFVLISLSEILMKFFIESLGGNRVFNTYFGANSNEGNYIGFIGCRDLNIRVKESAETTIFLLKLTNVTYYMMGVMLILRKILLWFLLFVSPFLPLLLSFPLIRNTGRIWIGVFFQWLFYGPLFALFFGATAKLFENGIPFGFDFSRIEKTIGYVFPTAIIILYGGPAQKANGLNSGNYIDTFIEYVIALILWWAVTWFPWWLLRIYRDDCCDGIYAMRNAVLALLDKIPTKPDQPIAPPPQKLQGPKFELDLPSTKTTSAVQKIRLDNHNVVRQTKTETIADAMNLRATTLKDIARIETNSTQATKVRQNLALLENPLSAMTATDRQTYLNIRTEFFTRASTKNDVMAQRILASINKASQSYINRKKELLSSAMSKVATTESDKSTTKLSQATATNNRLSENKVTETTVAIVSKINNSHAALEAISANAKTTVTAVRDILSTYAQSIDKPFTTIIDKISATTQITKDKVHDVLRETQSLIRRTQRVKNIAGAIEPDKTQTKKLLSEMDRLVSGVSTEANIAGSQMTIKIAQLVLNIINTNPEQASSLMLKSQAEKNQVKDILNQFSSIKNVNIDTVKQIADTTGIPQEKIVKVIVEAAKIAQSKSDPELSEMSDPNGVPYDVVVRSTVESGHSMLTTPKSPDMIASDFAKVFSDKKIVTVTREILKNTVGDNQIIATIQQNTGLSRKQVQQTLESISQSPSITDAESLQKLEASSGVVRTKAFQVVQEAVKHANTAGEISLETTSSEEDVEITRMLEDQLELALNPQKQIDLAITVDPSQIDEYEEIKKIWIEQYKNGDIPINADILTRADWVRFDLDLISNVLNNLISKDEKLRQQALDEVGFILPIFLMNNLSADKLILYLKAKASAAREVQQDLEKTSLETDTELLEKVRRQSGPVEENTRHLEINEQDG